MKFRGRGWAMLAAGFLWGGAALLRPVYQIVLIPLAAWLVYYFLSELRASVRVLAGGLAAALAGAAVILAPQFYINASLYHVYSPFVQASVRHHTATACS